MANDGYYPVYLVLLKVPLNLWVFTPDVNAQKEVCKKKGSVFSVFAVTSASEFTVKREGVAEVLFPIFFHTTSYNMFWVSKTKTHGKMTDDFLFWGLPYPNCSEIPIIFWWSLVTYCLQTLVLTFRWIRDVCFTITKTAYLTTWQPVHRNPPISPASWGLPKSLDAVTWIPWDEIWDMRLTDRL